MTVELCEAFCVAQSGLDYDLAGLEYGSECYCGDTLGYKPTLGYTDCSTACVGNTCEVCEGGSRLSVFNLTTAAPPTVPQQIGTYVFEGCYTDNVAQRILPSFSISNSSAVTNEYCVQQCSARMYQWAGTEYGHECWCANALGSNANKTDITECNE